MTSDEAPSTRQAILQACLDLLEQGTAPSMSEIAARAGKSRQAVYLHFDNRTGLLLAAVEHARAKFGARQAYETILANPDPDAALKELLALHIVFTPRIISVSRAIEAIRTQDREFDLAWQTRDQGNRLALAGGVVAKFADAGRLAPGWSLASATDWLWALLSTTFMADLLARGRTLEEVNEMTFAATRAFLLSELDLVRRDIATADEASSRDRRPRD